VKLIVDNPTLDDPFVAQPTVAQGKFRETPWSAPSPPAVVNKDVEYGLVALKETKGHNDGADLNVVQFDTNLGSYIMDTIRVYYGSYVGYINKDTLHLDFLTPALKEEPVTFSSKDVLLDGTAGKLTDTAAGDLGLDPKKSKKLLEMAVTLNRFGEIEEWTPIPLVTWALQRSALRRSGNRTRKSRKRRRTEKKRRRRASLMTPSTARERRGKRADVKKPATRCAEVTPVA
jgi:hypothetical protein